jgi:hypothetical protein
VPESISSLYMLKTYCYLLGTGHINPFGFEHNWDVLTGIWL